MAPHTHITSICVFHVCVCFIIHIYITEFAWSVELNGGGCLLYGYEAGLQEADGGGDECRKDEVLSLAVDTLVQVPASTRGTGKR